MYVLTRTSRCSLVHRTHHLDLAVVRNQVALRHNAASVPRKIEDHRGFSVVGDVSVVQEMGFESRQDGRACGLLILDESNVGRRDVKDIHQVPLKCSCIVDSSEEWGEIIHGEILVQKYEPRTTYTGEGDPHR